MEKIKRSRINFKLIAIDLTSNLVDINDRMGFIGIESVIEQGAGSWEQGAGSRELYYYLPKYSFTISYSQLLLI